MKVRLWLRGGTRQRCIGGGGIPVLGQASTEAAEVGIETLAGGEPVQIFGNAGQVKRAA